MSYFFVYDVASEKKTSWMVRKGVSVENTGLLFLFQCNLRKVPNPIRLRYPRKMSSITDQHGWRNDSRFAFSATTSGAGTDNQKRAWFVPKLGTRKCPVFLFQPSREMRFLIGYRQPIRGVLVRDRFLQSRLLFRTINWQMFIRFCRFLANIWLSIFWLDFIAF